MSYRAIKRVFGETKLELKLLFLFGVGMLVVIVTSFWIYGRQTADVVYQQNKTTAQILVDLNMVSKHWATETSVNTNVPRFPAVMKDEDDKNYQYVIWMTGKLSKQKNKFEVIWPDRNAVQKAPRDPTEQTMIDKFLAVHPDPQVDPQADPDATREGEGLLAANGQEYQYFEPIRAQPDCLTTCHSVPLGGSGIDALGSGVPFAGQPVSASAPPLSVGDIIAIAKVTIPTRPTQKKMDKNWAFLWATAILAVFMAMVTSYAIVRYVIVKPLRHLRDVSDSVSRGNIELRAEIHTGDEFEELSSAFNRMLRSLVAIQEELRQGKVDLDTKVDELAQVNMRLYEMNMLKSDFLATMSHELRTPLNSILGFSDVLGGITSLDEKQKRYVQNIQKSGRTLLEMINDILDLAKMESGRMETRVTDCNLLQMVGAQTDMARPLAEKKNIDVEIEISPDLPPMRQDQARVQQILNNLISNAIKFTPEGGRVTINARRDDDDYLVLQVVDTGVGIAEEDQQVIFEKFRQGRVGVPTGDAMTREYSGSGLGLSIVMELCKLLGGSVSVASELGRGSTFTVRLPWTIHDASRMEPALGDAFADAARD